MAKNKIVNHFLTIHMRCLRLLSSFIEESEFSMAKVLVIEDEHELRELIVAELEDYGHRTIQASDGEQGLKKALTDKPDIILADINMPKMNGHQLRGHLKKNHPEHAKIPFMFLSALADPADIADGLMIGADHYLTKPVNFDMLQGWINDLTRGN